MWLAASQYQHSKTSIDFCINVASITCTFDRILCMLSHYFCIRIQNAVKYSAVFPHDMNRYNRHCCTNVVL